MRNLGFISSPLDPRDDVYKSSSVVPTTYELKNVESVINQGEMPICAAISLQCMIGWQRAAFLMKDGPSYRSIYDLRKDKSQDGMIPREALKSLKKEGVGGYKIKAYSRVEDVDSTKAAILINGPMMVCFMAYDSEQFWKPEGQKLGGHAVILIGWNKEGFILQNSWGIDWCDKGRTILPYKDWDAVIEAWTIMI